MFLKDFKRLDCQAGKRCSRTNRWRESTRCLQGLRPRESVVEQTCTRGCSCSKDWCNATALSCLLKR